MGGSDHRAATGTELFVTANERGQRTNWGDSGGPLLEIANGGDLLDQPLMGIIARMTLEDGGWRNFYTPLQHYWPWLCSALGC